MLVILALSIKTAQLAITGLFDIYNGTWVSRNYTDFGNHLYVRADGTLTLDADTNDVTFNFTLGSAPTVYNYGIINFVNKTTNKCIFIKAGNDVYLSDTGGTWNWVETGGGANQKLELSNVGVYFNVITGGDIADNINITSSNSIAFNSNLTLSQYDLIDTELGGSLIFSNIFTLSGTVTAGASVYLDYLIVDGGTANLSGAISSGAGTNVNVINGGIFIARAGSMKFTDNFVVDGTSTFTHNSGLINFTGAGGANFNPGSNNIYDLAVANPAKTVTLTGDITQAAGGTVTVGTGILRATSKTLSFVDLDVEDWWPF